MHPRHDLHWICVLNTTTLPIHSYKYNYTSIGLSINIIKKRLNRIEITYWWLEKITTHDTIPDTRTTRIANHDKRHPNRNESQHRNHESRHTVHDTRITNHDTRITNHDTRITTPMSRHTTRKSRTTTQKSRITSHETLVTGESPWESITHLIVSFSRIFRWPLQPSREIFIDICSLESWEKITTHDNRITPHESRYTNRKSQIDNGVTKSFFFVFNCENEMKNTRQPTDNRDEQDHWVFIHVFNS